MARPLREDLLRRLVLPMATILLVSGGLSYQLSIRFADRSFDRALLEDARALSRLSMREASRGEARFPAAALGMLNPGEGDHVFVQVRSRYGSIVAGNRDLPSPPEDSGIEPVFFNASIRNESVRVVAIAFEQPEAEGGEVLLVGETRRRRESLASDIVAAVIAPQIALIFFAVVVIVGGVASGLAPIENLAHSIETRDSDNLDLLPETDVPGEAVPLIHAFNRLLGRLSEAQQAQRRFVADAAHQLRTPLAALRIQLGEAVRTVDADRRQAILGELESSVERTARLSGQLLLLARAEPGGAPRVRAPVDLVKLAREVGSLWVPRALKTNRDLGLAVEVPTATVSGDATLLAELIGNLIDNALRYGGPNITLSVATTPHPELSVRDDGPGIPEPERQRVFERFHRVPGSPGDGSGLGLSIVSEIAAAHGAVVGLETPDGGGLCVCVRFSENQHSRGETG